MPLFDLIVQFFILNFGVAGTLLFAVVLLTLGIWLLLDSKILELPGK